MMAISFVVVLKLFPLVSSFVISQKGIRCRSRESTTKPLPFVSSRNRFDRYISIFSRLPLSELERDGYASTISQKSFDSLKNVTSDSSNCTLPSDPNQMANHQISTNNIEIDTTRFSTNLSTSFPENNEYEQLAKKLEPGDRELIIRSIKKFQQEVWKNDPVFPWETILSRTFDTIEDIFLHAKRVPYDYGWINEKDITSNRETVVVLGSGWGAHAYLKVADTYKKRIIVVSPSNHFVFTPMLASAAVGTVEYRSMTEAVRAANPMIDNYIEGTAIDIDVDEQSITVQLKSLLETTNATKPDPITINYDKLIVAVGCKVADSIVPGAKEYTLRLKSCDDARRLRIAVGEAFEYASRPDVQKINVKTVSLANKEESEIFDQHQEERCRRVTFCIIGGGPTGVELAGELADFIQDICKPRIGAYPDLLKDVRIVLLHGGATLVPQFDTELGQVAYKTLTESGVDVRLNTRVLEVTEDSVRIRTKTGASYDSQVEYEDSIIRFGLCVWAAGTEPIPFVTKLLHKLPESARGSGGKVNVDPWLRCPMKDTKRFGSILVLGDAAAFLDPTSGSLLPQTAQVAAQQGAYAARLLDRDYNLTVTPPKLQTNNPNMELWLKARGLEESEGFTFLNLGLLAYVGGGKALSQVQIGNFPLASYAGSTAFVLWRSVYLVKQVATRNRVLVTFDWIKSAIFGRDITRL